MTAVYYCHLTEDVTAAWSVCIADGSCNASQKAQETFTLAAKSPDERRCWIQLLRQVLYRDAGGGKMCIV